MLVFDNPTEPLLVLSAVDKSMISRTLSNSLKRDAT
jgi:hypothetical protein